MPIVPPTPFLPHSKHFLEDQTLLIDTEPVYDDSFDSWSPTRTPGRVDRDQREPDEEVEGEQEYGGGAQRESLGDEDEVYSGTGEGLAGGIVTAWSGAVMTSKRQGGDTPMKTHTTKKVKAPTPIKDDFYTRRLKDSDRRSSLGLGTKDLTPGSLEPQTLYRSTSRSSIRSSTSSSRNDPFLSSSVMTARAGPSTYQQDHTPPSLPPPIYPLSRQTSATSTSLPTSSTVRGYDTLHRTVSNLSENSRSRRDSISDKVSGFFSRLLRREPSLSGPGHSEAERTESPGTDVGDAVDDIGVEITMEWVGSTEEAPQQSQESSLDHEGEEEDQSVNEEAGVEDATDEDVQPVPDIASYINPYNKPSAPKLRLPPPLTRPAPRQLNTATRALQPKKTIPGTNNTSADQRPRPTASSKATEKRSSNPPGPSKPSTTVRPPRPAASSFTARALSRLPAPGKGSSSSARPTVIRSAERAADLQAKKDRFELLAKQAAEERQKALSAYSSRPAALGLKRTVPVSGNTPGKASRQRAEERARFEKGLRERHEEKERRDEEMRRAKEDMEAAEERVRRGERVVWAKEVPQMYKRGKE